MPSLSLDANENITRIFAEFIKYTSTVTTVGYGDSVPISNIGRKVAIFYIFFGIAMKSILLSVITNTFSKGRYGRAKKEEREQELNELISRLSAIEEKQSKCMELFN